MSSQPQPNMTRQFSREKKLSTERGRRRRISLLNITMTKHSSSPTMLFLLTLVTIALLSVLVTGTVTGTQSTVRLPRRPRLPLRVPPDLQEYIASLPEDDEDAGQDDGLNRGANIKYESLDVSDLHKSKTHLHRSRVPRSLDDLEVEGED